MDKAELRSIYGINKKIRLKQQQLKEMEEDVINITLNYSEKVQTSRMNNSMDKVDSILELRAMIKGEISLLYEKRKEAYILFQNLKGKRKSVMEMRYLQGYEWEKIAVDLELSYRHVIRLHGEALQQLFG